MIASSLLLAQYFDTPIYALAVGVMLGGILQLAVQWKALASLGLVPRYNVSPKKAWADPTVQRILRQMLPAILGVSVAQISLLINTNIATWLQAGSVTWLSFADRLMEFPTALLGVALGTVLLPKLSAAYSSGEKQHYAGLLDWGLRTVILLGVPCAMALALISDALVASLFHYGAFEASDVEQTRLAVGAYSVGLLGLLAIKILAPAFYAQQDIKTPVRIAIVVLVLTQLLNIFLVPTFAHAGLALSIGIGASFNALALLYLLYKRDIYAPRPGWGLFLLRLLPALALLGLCLWGSQHYIDWIALGERPFIRLSYLAGLLITCAIAYFVPLFLCGFRLRHFTKPS